MRHSITAKLAVVGEQFAGKSSIALKYTKGTFHENTEGTIGAAFLTKTIESGNYTIKLQIWDTAGQERYRSLAPMYYRGALACIIVYDITSMGSFERAQAWVKELKADSNPMLLVLVGNKYDLDDDREVETKKAAMYADEQNLRFFETSAKTNHNIEELFAYIGTQIPNFAPDKRDTETVVPTTDDRSGTEGKCC